MLARMNNELLQIEQKLKEAEGNPVEFFAQAEKKFNKEELSSLFGYFLTNSDCLFLLKETIKEIDMLKDERNMDDLIDFLMSENLKNKDLNEVINLKIICIKAISNFKNKKCIPALLYCLNDKTANYKMRFQAAEALGKIGDKNAVDSLINIVSDEEEKSVYVRESAAAALGMIGDMRAIDPFLTILETKKNFLDKFTFLKERVMEALAKINFISTERLMSAFKNALRDESPQVRINAIECIMNSGVVESYDIIKTMLSDSDSEVVKNAVCALYNLKGKEALLEILKDNSISACAKEEADEIFREYEENEQ
ncbi:MAG: HEAT repeat domain-containing protein [Candidatus Gastranaerophilales bacterium]|nr:HEAT repeat domain-containing protein [Candidatus Gastranaerophilales bacterium]